MMDDLLVERVAKAIHSKLLGCGDWEEAWNNKEKYPNVIEQFTKMAIAAIDAMQPNSNKDTFAGIAVVSDPSIPPGEAHFKDKNDGSDNPSDELNIELHVITGLMNVPSSRWCQTCRSSVCVLDDPTKT